VLALGAIIGGVIGGIITLGYNVILGAGIDLYLGALIGSIVGVLGSASASAE
jgi:hypothetical protein